MNSGGMDAVQLALVTGVVTALVKMIQAFVGSLGGPKALTLYLVLSAIGVALWVISQTEPVTNTWVFGLFAAWVQIAMAAAGLSATVDRAVGAANRGP